MVMNIFYFRSQEHILCKVAINKFSKDVVSRVKYTEAFSMFDVFDLVRHMVQGAMFRCTSDSSVKLVMYVCVAESVYLMSIVTDRNFDFEEITMSVDNYIKEIVYDTHLSNYDDISYVYDIEEACSDYFDSNSEYSSYYYPKSEDPVCGRRDIFTFSNPNPLNRSSTGECKRDICQSFIGVGIKFPLMCSLDEMYECSDIAATIYKTDGPILDMIVPKRNFNSFKYYSVDNTVPKSLSYITDVIK